MPLPCVCMLNICLHVLVDELYAAVALKWPDGRSCSLCGIQTELRLLWLHGEANVWRWRLPNIHLSLQICFQTALILSFFGGVMRNAWHIWALKLEGYTVYIHVLPSGIRSFPCPGICFALWRVCLVIRMWFHHTLSSQYYLPQLETCRSQIFHLSVRRFHLFPQWQPLQGGLTVEWRNMCSSDWKHVEIKTSLRYPRHVRESCVHTSQNQAFGFCSMWSVPSWLSQTHSFIKLGLWQPEYPGHRCIDTETLLFALLPCS